MKLINLLTNYYFNNFLTDQQTTQISKERKRGPGRLTH